MVPGEVILWSFEYLTVSIALVAFEKESWCEMKVLFLCFEIMFGLDRRANLKIKLGLSGSPMALVKLGVSPSPLG